MRPLFLFLCLIAALPAGAADFRSIAEGGTLMYDAPSTRAKKLYVVSRDYPVEILVSIEGWAKVRDVAGELVWVEKKALSDKRMVVVTAAVAEARQSPGEQSGLAFRAQQGVVLELAETGTAGWVKVRLRDGRAGYIRIGQLWGL